MTLIEFALSVISGIIANLLFAIILVWLVQQYRYWYNLKRKFHNQLFEVYRKRFPNQVVYVMKCEVKGNVIKFSDKTKNLCGEFIVNPINLKIGEGFHFHNDDSDGYGFSKLIIKDENTFLVDSPYIAIKENDKKDKVGSIIYQAFIWRRRTIKEMNNLNLEVKDETKGETIIEKS